MGFPKLTASPLEGTGERVNPPILFINASLHDYHLKVTSQIY